MLTAKQGEHLITWKSSYFKPLIAEEEKEDKKSEAEEEKLTKAEHEKSIYKDITRDEAIRLIFETVSSWHMNLSFENP